MLSTRTVFSTVIFLMCNTSIFTLISEYKISKLQNLKNSELHATAPET